MNSSPINFLKPLGIARTHSPWNRGLIRLRFIRSLRLKRLIINQVTNVKEKNKSGLLMGTLDGSLSTLIAIDERTYRRFAMLQSVLGELFSYQLP